MITSLVVVKSSGAYSTGMSSNATLPFTLTLTVHALLPKKSALKPSGTARIESSSNCVSNVFAVHAGRLSMAFGPAAAAGAAMNSTQHSTAKSRRRALWLPIDIGLPGRSGEAPHHSQVAPRRPPPNRLVLGGRVRARTNAHSPLSQPDLAAPARVGVPPLLLVRHGDQSGNRHRLVLVVERDHRQERGARVADVARRHLLGLDPHAHLERGPPGRIDRRPQREQVAYVHGRSELHAVDRRGHHPAADVPRGGDRRHLVAELHDPAAVDVA